MEHVSRGGTKFTDFSIGVELEKDPSLLSTGYQMLRSLDW